MNKIFQKYLKDYTSVLVYDFAMGMENENLTNHESEKICKVVKTFLPQQAVSHDIRNFF